MSQVKRFTFESRVYGAGGFAKVIKGRDNVLERDIAVKVLDTITTAFPEPDQERFRREARILARLSHPNIPAIYDIDFSEGGFLIIFQFIEGQTLREIIDEEGPTSITIVRTWFQQIASALDSAHELSIVHRDVKPSNIIITPNRETAYLVDFGIALSKEDAVRITESGFVIGTPGYMSPEQISGDEVDARSDIYSLGITMYEVLAGRPIPQGQYEDLSILNEAIPPEIDRLIQECLLQRDRRVASAKAFSALLAGALRTQKPLSEVLTTGRLHEIAIALEPLSPEEFIALPEGQRSLVLIKLSDIVLSSNPQLELASEQFLQLLLTRGLLLDKGDYQEIINPAIRWSFEQKHGDFVGSPNVRREIVRAAAQARLEIHQVISEAILSYFGEVDFGSKDDWYLNGARDILQRLLANPACPVGTTDLGRMLRAINAAQRDRP
jgi:serine/threonine protein kinase